MPDLSAPPEPAVPENEAHVTRPLLYAGGVYRLVSGVSQQVVVEEWAGEYWQPSLVPLHLVYAAPLAPDELLDRACVPRGEWRPWPDLRWETPALIRLVRRAFALVGPSLVLAFAWALSGAAALVA